ncbi:phage tail-collar fiber domain-containing protein [Laribacter hongkongensis]|uniref:phage tail-collar fiber domain-containing protein n=1 Tax=Laribacter hongkongensis TaxID=168471 RepID=UPI001EFE35E9|nr:phage tail protein [Laribacter hongkongensis]MCG9083935.1 phage tail protein [Laribacter hongkongensis]
MPQEFFSTLTVVGEARLASAAALGSSLQLTHLAVGDGGGVRVMPTPAQTKLVREIRRAPVNRVETDTANPGQIIIEQVIPEAEGGWWIREIGVFDKDGNLIAVGNCPDTYKPLLAEGSGRTQVIRMVLIVSSTDAVTLKIDPSVVLATKQHVTETVAKAISDHVKQPDPHPQYLTEAEGKQRIDAAVAALVAGSPAALDTLKELADALGGDRNFSATVMSMIAGKLDKTETAADSAKLGGQPPGYYAAALNAVPPGFVGHFAMSSHPTGWLKANGAAVSRTAYSALFAAIGTKFGGGDGVTTFNLPDLRGEFLRGLDDGRGLDPGRALGSVQSENTPRHAEYVVGTLSAAVSLANGSYVNGHLIGSASLVAANTGENRPRNVALLACIKY